MPVRGVLHDAATLVYGEASYLAVQRRSHLLLHPEY
jgi:hypothetical protein